MLVYTKEKNYYTTNVTHYIKPNTAILIIGNVSKIILILYLYSIYYI